MSESVVSVPIVKVTLFEDRAHVSRRGATTLAAGTSRLRIEGVAPALSDKTLFASSGDPSVRVVHARVERVAVAERGERPERLRGLEQSLRDAQHELQTLVAERNREARRQVSLARATELSITEISESAAHGDLDPSGCQATFEATAAAECETAERLVVLHQAIRDAERDLADLQARCRAAASPADRVSAAIVLDVVADASAETEIGVDYVVPGACWRPYHRARWVGELLAFQCDGCVWQNTGEPWNEVELCFSTERLSLGARPPVLQTDVLSIRKRAPTIAVQHRDREVERGGLGGGSQKAVLGIDDGGEVLALPSRSKASIPSDGRPYRVPIFGFETPADSELVLAGERVEAIVERTRHDHSGPYPILAGPVDLVKGSGIVGRTRLLFVAPGERFELGWGPDPALRVHREVEQLDVQESTLTGWHSRRHHVRLYLSNLGPASRTIEVVERIPVSELDKVEIQPHPADTTGQQKPDRDGFVRWVVKLGPRARETVRLSFTVKNHPDVIGM